jgi:hypothetical protein
MNGKLYEIRCGQGLSKESCPYILKKQWVCAECTAARFIERIKSTKTTTNNEKKDENE